MSTLSNILAAAPTGEAEAKILREWSGRSEPQRRIRFSLRNRNNQMEFAAVELSGATYDQVEVVFEPTDGGEGEQFVWRPKSAEALEALFLE